MISRLKVVISGNIQIIRTQDRYEESQPQVVERWPEWEVIEEVWAKSRAIDPKRRGIPIWFNH